jgi:hypothetical protein
MSKNLFAWTTWTMAHDELLRRRWLSASASEIAIEVNRSRNSVIGRAWRLGLHKAPPRPRKGWKALRDRPLARRGSPPGPPPAPLAVAESPDVYDRRPGKSIWELDIYDCRFPLGETCNKGDFRYCGAIAARRFGYCAHHSRRMVAGGGK